MRAFAFIFSSLLICSQLSAQTVPADLELADMCPTCPNFSNPMGINQAAGVNLYFVHEHTGRLKVVDEVAASVTTILDFGATAPPGGFLVPGSSSDERGFLGLAFHPLYASNRFMFVSYSDGNGDTMIARYTLSAATPPVVDLGSRRVILRVDQDFTNHNGGHITFGPDGYLYIGLGDGGSSNDPCARAQSITPSDLDNTGSCAVDSSFVNSGGNADSRTLLGSILRIDVDSDTTAGSNELCAANADGSANYAIPGDNPFAGSASVVGACDEILHLGIRNPWRFSFDRDTGDLLIGDVGQNAREEVDFRPFGAATAVNFGWDCREGFIAASGTCRAGATLTDPVLDYTHSLGFSITGGFVYRGPIAQMSGVYFYADYLSMRIWTATQTAPGVFGPQPTTGNAWITAPSRISSFGEDAVGNVYVVGYTTNRIYRLTSPSAGDNIFATGFE